MSEPTSQVENQIAASATEITTGGSSVMSTMYVTKHVKSLVSEGLKPIIVKLLEMKDSTNDDVKAVIYIF